MSKPSSISNNIPAVVWPGHSLTLPWPPDNGWRVRLEQLSKDVIVNVSLFGDESHLVAMSHEIQHAGIVAPQTAIISQADVQGGLQIDTLSGVITTPLFDEGRRIGTFFEDADAKYCILGDLRPSNPAASRGAQTQEVLETVQKTLASVGMHFRDVVRTWFYVDRILDWYAEFNSARTAFFQQHGIDRMPASTGVGAPNGAGAVLAARVIAVLPKTGAVTIRPVESPLQCDAFAYGSSFSRAMEVAGPGSRSLYISGTASIEPGGKTAHVGDTARQIEKTMEVVGAILTHSGMSLADITRAIAYFRHREDLSLWADFCRSRDLPPMPVIVTQCDICRDDLLFEIELDAVRG